MQKVIAINLNGNAYHVEEAGYDALIAYLETAQRQLRDNPDRDEILADLEQAIGEKCRRFLSANKTVVLAPEIDQIITEMGPVDGAADATGASGAREGGDQARTSSAGAPRRLYRIPDGAMLAGVCNGVGAFFNIDPTIVRVVFIALLFFTGGGFAIVYVILAFVLPEANTSEERAAAHGHAFNARELIDRAKREYGDFKSRRDRNRYWRWEHREWKRQWRQRRRDWQWNDWTAPPYAPASNVGYGTRLLAGITVPVLTLISVALFWLWLFSIFSLVAQQEVFGQALPDGVPLWLGIVVLVFIYQAFAWPLYMARRSAYYAIGGAYHGMVATLDGLFSLAFMLVALWLAFHYIPEVRDFLQHLPDVFRSFRDSLKS